ncbi:MAG: S24 family peptidase [Pseudomonadota bacterium]|nr:S24 family peptidase [Pseudomonadota bacterium]
MDDPVRQQQLDAITRLQTEEQVTLKDLSRIAGKSDSYVFSFVSRAQPRRLAEEARINIAKHFGLDPGTLAPLVPGMSEAAALFEHAPPGNTAPASEPLPTRHEMPQDVPIYGTAAASLEGAMQIEQGGTPVDYARRPPALITATDVYSLFVQGDSMLPKYANGELIFVSSRRPPRIDDFVVVQSAPDPHDGTKTAWLKQLVRRDRNTVTLREFHPTVREFTLRASEFSTVHRVFTTNELFGIA